MEILNSLPSLDSLQVQYNTLVLDTLKRLNSIIENACEFYKIFKQKNIHKEINKQIIEHNEELLNNHENHNGFEPLEKIVPSENRLPVLNKLNTNEVVDEASNNLANLIKEYEKKEQENTTQQPNEEIKKKLIQQAKTKEEQKPKPQESHFKKKATIETPNRLETILKISAKKPEVESMIKLYLNKSGELKDMKEDGPNLMKSQKIVQEEIKKTKKNIQQLAHKNNKLAWQEDREVFITLIFLN